MMELKKETVQMLRVKSKAASQVTFDEDYNVPDTRPDIGRMIQSKGRFPWMKCALVKEGLF